MVDHFVTVGDDFLLPAGLTPGLNGFIAARALGKSRTRMELQRKGSVIGTAGKSVVSIRFDHQFAPLRDVIWPLLVARGLPASVGIVSRYPTGDGGSAGVTWSDIRNIIAGGCEAWCHSATHANPTTLAMLIDEIVTSKAEIEAQGIQVCGWQVPGVGTLTTYPDWTLSDINALAGPAGSLVEQTYGFSDGYTPSTFVRSLPHSQYHGLNHQTGEVLSVAETKSCIDQAVAYGGGLQLMYHPYYIGQATYITVADFTAVLDYIVGLRDSGVIEVLTATGLIAADPNRSMRAQLIGNPSFDPTFTSLWTGWSFGAGVALTTTGAHTGTNCVTFTQSGTGVLQQITSQPSNAGFAGCAVRVEAWMKMVTTAGVGKIRVVDGDTPSQMDITKSFNVTSSTWTKVWFNTVLHPLTARLRIELSRAAGSDNIVMDDISITPV